MFKKCQVVMLPTNEKEQITFVKHTQGKNVGKLQIPIAGGEYRRLLQYDFEPQHLYILSDEEIKEGDWFYYKHFGEDIIDQTKETTDLVNLNKPDRYFKKIIAASNNSLNTDKRTYIFAQSERKHLPQPSQSFIEKYVEEYNRGNIITDVMVEYWDNSDYNPSMFPDIRLKINPDNTINTQLLKESWNRDEVVILLKQVIKDCHQDELEEHYSGDYRNLTKWIETNL